MAAHNSRAVFNKLVEQPEPSVDGGHWYVVDLRDLIAEGFTHVEVHYPDGSDFPDDLVLTKEPAVRQAVA